MESPFRCRPTILSVQVFTFGVAKFNALCVITQETVYNSGWITAYTSVDQDFEKGRFNHSVEGLLIYHLS